MARALKHLWSCLDLDQGSVANLINIYPMATFIFRCPTTGLLVQALYTDDADGAAANDGECYETITCSACKQIHLVNPITGRTLGTPKRRPF
jgi:hypothetical protein